MPGIRARTAAVLLSMALSATVARPLLGSPIASAPEDPLLSRPPALVSSSPAPVSIFKVGRADAGLIAAATGLQAFAQYRYFSMEAAGPDRLRRGDLWAMDRWAAGNYSTASALASDILIFPGVGAPLLLSAWDARKAGRWAPLVTEAVVYAEAMAVSSSLNLMVRSLRVHSRPLVYGSDAPEDEKRKGEASGSFYSGHANASFLAAVYLSYTYPLRHPEFEREGLLWAGSLAAAAGVAALRVSAGKHFPSDVVAGAMTGAFFGWLFPRLHLADGAGGKAQLRFLPVEEGVHPAVVVRF